ncbi:MAG: dGTPase [Lachnospiraceae bacterium]|nr:dGTPase [Lachnospiraceae bacterium]MBR4608372.1 dGTPase [Lachnospiraceae bacterium]MBR6152036.1 dGTPase [Lachnospiraceae bacterium]
MGKKENKYSQLLCVDRLRTSSIKRGSKIDEFYSDRSRIIYSSSFRRLLQKAQVFSLEPNASVRTRLTHSLEVSDIGRTLSNQIASRLYAERKLDADQMQEIVAVVENACLLHDIGNPPFGHFGEIAIRDWAKNKAIEAIPEGISKKDKLLNKLMEDFYEFDGNPQGFRTITKLHTDYDQYSLNLTYATLLCALKYSRVAGEPPKSEITKKAGCFLSEKDIFEDICNTVGIELHHRYPLTYIMEAADDIAYCMSDIADGIEKRILNEDIFIKEFLSEWDKAYPRETIQDILPKNDKVSFGRDISVPWSRKAVSETVENYFERENDILNGVADSLINRNKPMGRVLETIKKVSRRILYSSFDAENIELTGYAVITGILRHYERLLSLSNDEFLKLVNGEKTANLDVERRLFNRLGHRYVSAYTYALEGLKKENHEYAIQEWWLRVHLLLDHVSGMTDEYALETYQMLEGIKLMHK